MAYTYVEDGNTKPPFNSIVVLKFVPIDCEERKFEFVLERIAETDVHFITILYCLQTQESLPILFLLSYS